MAIIEDMSVFFDEDDFAVEADLHELQGDTGYTIKGIFDKEYEFVDAGVGVDDYNPVFSCSEDDIGTAQKGYYLTIDNLEYKIVGVQPDGTGGSTVLLERDDRWQVT